MLTGSMQSEATTAVSEGSAVGVVDVDGRPHLVRAGIFTDQGANPAALQAARQRYLSSPSWDQLQPELQPANPMTTCNHCKPQVKPGGAPGARTLNLRIKSPLLCH
jgi:hypothetical protein